MEVRVRINQAKQTTWGSLGFHELDDDTSPIQASPPSTTSPPTDATSPTTVSSPNEISAEALAVLLRRLELVIKVSGMTTFEIFRGLWYVFYSLQIPKAC
jgi:hypothetical protein